MSSPSFPPRREFREDSLYTEYLLHKYSRRGPSQLSSSVPSRTSSSRYSWESPTTAEYKRSSYVPSRHSSPSSPSVSYSSPSPSSRRPPRFLSPAALRAYLRLEHLRHSPEDTSQEKDRTEERRQWRQTHSEKSDSERYKDNVPSSGIISKEGNATVAFSQELEALIHKYEGVRGVEEPLEELKRTLDRVSRHNLRDLLQDLNLLSSKYHHLLHSLEQDEGQKENEVKEEQQQHTEELNGVDSLSISATEELSFSPSSPSGSDGGENNDQFQ